MITELTEEEAQRYDRQVRIWGAAAQVRMQTSTILVCGFRGLNVEVVKNLVLVGVSMIIQDDTVVSLGDLSHNFFLCGSDVGKNTVEAILPRVQDLNCLAKVGTETRPIDSIEDAFFSQFDVIITSSEVEAQALRLNALCRKSEPHKPFFWSGVFGNEGWFISDFGSAFSYKDDAPRNKDVITARFPSLQSVLQKPWIESVSKFFPLSLTFVKSRILSRFRNFHGRIPTQADSDILMEIATACCHDQGLLHPDIVPPTVFSVTSSSGSSSSSLSTSSGRIMESATILAPPHPALSGQQITDLARTASQVSVLTCSVLGSFLSQEVVKAVSGSGEPGFNTFVYDGDLCDVKAIPIK